MILIYQYNNIGVTYLDLVPIAKRFLVPDGKQHALRTVNTHISTWPAQIYELIIANIRNEVQ